jgi:hypothetical protein
MSVVDDGRRSLAEMETTISSAVSKQAKRGESQERDGRRLRDDGGIDLEARNVEVKIVVEHVILIKVTDRSDVGKLLIGK